MIINVAEDYTKTPGGRFASEGDFSGEDFREKILKPRFIEAITSGDTLTVILDGGYGYAISFLEEAFGGLARELNDTRLLDIRIISEEEPPLVDKIQQYIKDALQ